MIDEEKRSAGSSILLALPSQSLKVVMFQLLGDSIGQEICASLSGAQNHGVRLAGTRRHCA